MPRERWARDAVAELDLALTWLELHRGVDEAARAAFDIAAAVERAAKNPRAYPWVGSVYPELSVLGRDVRRVIARRSRHTIFFRVTSDGDGVQILAVRGAGQLPPAARVMTARSLQVSRRHDPVDAESPC